LTAIKPGVVAIFSGTFSMQRREISLGWFFRYMSSGYGTLVVKPKLQFGTRWEIILPLESGNGMVQCRYGGEYRESCA